jgi:hypothetical protein
MQKIKLDSEREKILKLNALPINTEKVAIYLFIYLFIYLLFFIISSINLYLFFYIFSFEALI